MGDHRRERAADDAEQFFASWSHVQVRLTTFLEETRSFRGVPLPSADGERGFLALAGVHLIEPRHSGEHYVGGTPETWVRLKAGIHCEIGPPRGCLVPGVEQPTPVDIGALLITDRRVLLCGAAEQREWSFSTLRAVHHDPDQPWTALQSDQPTVSGVLYGHADRDFVRFRMMLALAVHTRTVTRLRAALEASLAAHLAGRPPPPEP